MAAKSSTHTRPKEKDPNGKRQPKLFGSEADSSYITGHVLPLLGGEVSSG